MEILKIGIKGTKKTNIMFKVGLSHTQLEKYLSALEKENFIVEESGVWKITEKGKNVIDACKLCHRLVKEIP